MVVLVMPLFLVAHSHGFTGCVRSVIVNDEVVDIQHAAKGVDGLYLICEDRCNSNFCQNSGECIEDFATDAVACRCKYPNVQSGQNCEIGLSMIRIKNEIKCKRRAPPSSQRLHMRDINQNSSISFNGGFLKYDLLRNPLVDQTVISFRTDQSQALILFVHDHHNNFMQLHLSEEVNITLSLNNEAIVSSCTVRARPGTEFSNMEWIQITIEHSTQLSTLVVEDDACSIHATRKLAQKPVKKFTNVFMDIVIIPVGLDSPADPKPFLYTFIGGVERESHLTDGSMLLRPVYQCAIANLFGCIRGMKTGGEVIDLRHTLHGNRSNILKGVRSGCDMGCDTLNCKNGGHCSVEWHNGEKLSCDCSRTSYTGSECTIDEGLVFAANSYFLFDMGRFLSRFILTPQKRVTQTVQFAFAPASPSTSHQLLASVLFNDERASICQLPAVNGLAWVVAIDIEPSHADRYWV
ncbi:hypothetical protein KIN20_020746 [Parelaphostrongylus tenuis]|uniref:EGF-like domain-containing protein n=1 Tax=Parelaphostrongylus tenuis TaxID=148309 RepID=A0AAD5MN23_PARTN|nr:hypothetical protein KIN20_020746 [Parelaphostrongylus tenuis]